MEMKETAVAEVKQEEIEKLVQLYKSMDREARVVWMSGGSLLSASKAAREKTVSEDREDAPGVLQEA